MGYEGGRGEGDVREEDIGGGRHRGRGYEKYSKRGHCKGKAQRNKAYA